MSFLRLLSMCKFGKMSNQFLRVASINLCYMLGFLHVCYKSLVIVKSYKGYSPEIWLSTANAAGPQGFVGK